MFYLNALTGDASGLNNAADPQCTDTDMRTGARCTLLAERLVSAEGTFPSLPQRVCRHHGRVFEVMYRRHYPGHLTANTPIAP